MQSHFLWDDIWRKKEYSENVDYYDDSQDKFAHTEIVKKREMIFVQQHYKDDILKIRIIK